MNRSRILPGLPFFLLLAAGVLFHAACNFPDIATPPDPRDEVKCTGNIDLCSQLVVPEAKSLGSGTFDYSYNPDGTMNYTLSAQELFGNVILANIHLAGCDQNGEVVVNIFPDASGQGGVEANGEIISGVLRPSDLVNSLAGSSLEDLCSEFDRGNAYVVISTTVFPAGELRGQITDRGCNCSMRP